MQHDELDRYRPQIRRFLELCGWDVGPNGETRCPSPDHPGGGDEHAGSATCYETNVTCHVCDTSWDVFDACGLVKGMGTGRATFRERVKIVKETLGDFGGAGQESTANVGRQRVANPRPDTSSAPSFVPLPLEEAKRVYGEARKWMLSTAKKLGWGDTINGSWTCKDEQGCVELLVVRFEGGRRSKNVITFWWDGERVQCKNPPVRLFGRELLAANPTDPVCIHEGEKCWQAAKAIPGYVPVTWNGGAKKAKQVDWSPLAGREVIYYPDDDEPGRSTARAMGVALGKIARSFRAVEPLEAAREIKSRGADVVEALQVRSPQEMADYLRDGPELMPPEPGRPEDDGPFGAGADGGDRSALTDFPFRILGTADDGLTYFLDRSERLQALRLGSLSKTQLQLLAPLEWWISKFRGSRGRLDVDEAVDFVIEASNGRDFALASLRGRGAWREPPDAEGHVRLCYHDGVHTYGEPDSSCVYQRKAKMDMGLEVAPVSPETREAMLHAAGQMSFETQADCARLLAWAVLAPFCGALPWRPAGFLTGASKTGKSTILNLIVTRLARPLFISGESTAAFIRQETGNDCMGVVIDEAEAHTESDRRRMNEHFALMRQSFSDDSPRIGKGTTVARAISYMTRNMYLYSAISPEVEREADANRMFVVDLKRPDSSTWRTTRACVAKAFTLENCAAVRSFTWAHLAEIIDGTQAIADAIEEVAGMSSRDACREAILWSAHWRVWCDRFPSEAELREWLGTLYLLKRPEEPVDDASALMQRLLAEVVQLQDNPGRRFTVEHLALALASGFDEQPSEGVAGKVLVDEDKYRRTLGLYGLYVPLRGEFAGYLAVAINHQWVARTLGMSTQYAKTLARHPMCVHKSKTISPTGETSRKCMIFNPLVLGGESEGSTQTRENTKGDEG